MAAGIIPDLFTTYLTVATLLFIGIEVESYYVSRVTVFSNSVALLVHAEGFDRIGLFFSVYLLIGGIAGAYGMWKYLRDQSISALYYDSIYYTYSSASVGMVILVTALAGPNIHWVLVGLILAVAINTWFFYRAPRAMAPVGPEGLSLALVLTKKVFVRR